MYTQATSSLCDTPLAALAININFMSLKVSGMQLVNVPYNEKLSREKIFANFVDFRPSASYINSLAEPDPYARGEGLVTCYTWSCSAGMQ